MWKFSNNPKYFLSLSLDLSFNASSDSVVSDVARSRRPFSPELSEILYNTLMLQIDELIYAWR